MSEEKSKHSEEKPSSTVTLVIDEEESPEGDQGAGSAPEGTAVKETPESQTQGAATDAATDDAEVEAGAATVEAEQQEEKTPAETPAPQEEPEASLQQELYTEFLPGRSVSAEGAQEQAAGVDTIIRLTDLVKDYRVGWLQHKKFRALDGVSLEVKAGEIFGFLGPNGAGKTTAIKAMLGITKPTSGSIEMFGCSGVTRGARAHVGYFPEISYYYKYLSAREAVVYYGKLCNLPAKELKKRADWVLEIVGLYEQRNKLLSKFSKGMLQRVGLAQALINDPALLIMDEPTSGLDPLMKKEMRDLILSLNGEGKTIFFSSHELSEVEMICHRVAVLDKGKVIAQGPLSEIVPFEGALTVVAKKVPEKVVAKLQELGVSLSRENGNLMIRGIDSRNIYPLLAGLGANACELVEVRPQKQTLEDFFVNTITHKEMETKE